jgi:hypothetical protein
MSAPNSSAPTSATPGGELQQISPEAWPTENGGQTENSVPPPSIPPAVPKRLPNVAEPPEAAAKIQA